jgi:hypothetical protein
LHFVRSLFQCANNQLLFSGTMGRFKDGTKFTEFKF